MRKKELLQQIETLQDRIKQLEECIKTQDRLLEGYQKREQAVARAMQRVQEDAARRLAEAEEQARLIELQAKQNSSRLLAQTEATAAEYRDAVERYNAALEFAAAEAAANAERFASFVRSRKLAEGELVRETEGLSEIPFRSPISDLPDPEGDPAQLMQNIYRIQNRMLPEEETEEPVPAENVPQQESAACEQACDASAPCEAEQERSAEEILLDALMDEDFAEDGEDGFGVPTVNGVLEERAAEYENEQELSLDDLLDEIIKSGEQYHG